MREDRPDERLLKAASEYHRPPPVPRDRMWARISARRAVRRGPVRPPFWRSRRIWWPLAAAAVLTAGIVIGRLTHLPSAGSGDIAATSLQPEDVAGDATAGLPRTGAPGRADAAIYRYAAAPVLGRAELLLTQFRMQHSRPEPGETFSERASLLLSETRLLLDSPAAENAELHDLLTDLELVLARIVRIAEHQRAEETDRVEESLERSALLPRLRAGIPTGPLPLGT